MTIEASWIAVFLRRGSNVRLISTYCQGTGKISNLHLNQNTQMEQTCLHRKRYTRIPTTSEGLYHGCKRPPLS